jgi:predicted ATPase
MLLSKIEYFEHKNEPNYWEINDVVLTKQNVIVGLNATGKTRLSNIITNLGMILSAKVKKNGNWKLEFIKDEQSRYRFELKINDLRIDAERIWENDILILERTQQGGKIFSKSENNWHTYTPPADELTINARRDLEHYPYLEDFIVWAKGIKGFSFSGVKNNFIAIPENPSGQFEDLSAVPFILQQLQNNKVIIKKIIDDLTQIGYPTQSIETFGLQQPGIQNLVMVRIKETDLKCNTDQGLMSQGMYRALCLIVLFEYLLANKRQGTIIIDDLGEGLDYERSVRLTKLLFKKSSSAEFQLIVTSNDRFLINTVDIRNINFLSRQGHIVKSINYSNNKDSFEKYMLSGLNNFDFLQNKLRSSKN